MLVLTRRKGEAIVVVVPTETGPVEITIDVLALQDGKVKFGLTAPQKVVINRREVHERLHAPDDGRETA